MQQNLFSNLDLHRRTLKNRIVVAPPVSFLATTQGELTPVLINYHARLAQCEAAMVICEPFALGAERRFPRQAAMESANIVSMLSQLASVIRKNGAIPILALEHPGFNAWPLNPARKFWGPSTMKVKPLNRQVTELSYEQVGKIAGAFIDAAVVAWNAGFSGVEINGAQGTLLQQFLSPLFNKRQDRFDYERNFGNKLPIEIVRGIRKAFPDFLLLFKLAGRDEMPGGRRLKDTADFARDIEKAGADVLHLTTGFDFCRPDYENPGIRTSAPVLKPQDCQFIKKQVAIPVIFSGKNLSPTNAAGIIKAEMATAVSLGRSLNRDLEWFVKARLNSPNIPVRSCRDCQTCNSAAFGCPDSRGIAFWNLKKQNLREK
jgi:2,4-dienoyl-CoA reductase-like NADH-dependent reductase (Old Yellow Enzyme family)